jgi:dUTPase
MILENIDSRVTTLTNNGTILVYANTFVEYLIHSGKTSKIPLNLRLDFDGDYLCGMLHVKRRLGLRPQSGFFGKNFSGQMMVTLENVTPYTVFIQPGQLIGELIIMPVLFIERGNFINNGFIKTPGGE